MTSAVTMDRFLGKKKPLSFTTRSVSDKVTDKDRFEVIFPEGYQPCATVEDEELLGSGQDNYLSKGGKNKFFVK